MNEAKKIQQVVYNYLKPPAPDSKDRKRANVEARQFAMYYIRKYTPLSLSEVGTLFGDYDHATVLHACRTVEALIKFNGYQRKDIWMRHFIEKELEDNPLAWCDQVPQY